MLRYTTQQATGQHCGDATPWNDIVSRARNGPTRTSLSVPTCVALSRLVVYRILFVLFLYRCQGRRAGGAPPVVPRIRSTTRWIDGSRATDRRHAIRCAQWRVALGWWSPASRVGHGRDVMEYCPGETDNQGTAESIPGQLVPWCEFPSQRLRCGTGRGRSGGGGTQRRIWTGALSMARPAPVTLPPCSRRSAMTHSRTRFSGRRPARLGGT
jgi:hypothetical protein